MKVDEEFGHEQDNPFLTDGRENQTELTCTDYADEDDGGENSDPSFPLTHDRPDSSDESPLDIPNAAWPQSYRRSMDLLTGMTPPDISIIPGHGSDERRESSIVDSFSSSASKPFLSQPSLNKEEILNSTLTANIATSPSQLKLSVTGPPLPEGCRNCSFSQSVLNGINVLCGVGLLTTPYAVKEGGWLGLLVLLLLGVTTCYTGILMKRCLESSPALRTYPDIGQAAFGTTGRLIISILLYMELYAACVEYIIMVSDNLSRLFPNSCLSIAGLSLDSSQIFAVLITMIVLPTVWLKDLSLLSYLSFGGVLSSILLVLCLLWVGVFDGVGFHTGGQTLNLTNLSVAVGIYSFGYSGHPVLPNIYYSMKEPSKFPRLRFLHIFVRQHSDLRLHNVTKDLSSVGYTFLYAGVSILFRTILVLSTLVVALTVPFFAILAALIGSFTGMLIELIFPCICYLRILKGRLTTQQIGICIFIVVVGLVSGCCGTYSALERLVGNMA